MVAHYLECWVFLLCVYLQKSCGNNESLGAYQDLFFQTKNTVATVGLTLPFFCFCCFFLGFLSMLSIYFSPNKHKILSASFSSSTLKSNVRRKQKCPILPPVFCFRDGINLSEPIICSDLLGILHCMSTRELSIESLWCSRIYLFFSPPSGWLAVAPYSCGSVAHLQFLLVRAWLPPASPPLSHGSLCHHTKSHREMQPQGGRG